jgi:alkaline phosphatase
MKLSRRAMLGGLVVGAGASCIGWTAKDAKPVEKGKKPKNIIFCVVDGMPISSMTAVDYLRQLKEGKSSYWGWLANQPFSVNGLQVTRSLNSLVTDSSAASSTWGSGRRIWNGMVNMFPDKTELRTLTELMNSKGVKCGLVTTATITHATPAGFAVQCVQRDLEGLIAEKYLKSGVDVLFGGGGKFFSSTRRADKRDLYADFEKAGYKVVKTRDEMLASNSPRALGIFSDGHIPYTVDRDHDGTLKTTVPTLAEMTSKAIEVLSKSGSKNGFLLQVEGARVDHGGHSNDLAAMLFDQMAFEDAVKVCIDFAMEDEETLVIITADHACGGLALNGSGDEYADSTKGLQTVLNMRSSYGPMLSSIGTGATAEKVQFAVEDKLRIQLKLEEADAIASSMKGKHPFGLSEFFRSPSSTAGLILGNYTKCTFTSGNHHADHVLVTAYGPGSELCHGTTENVDFFKIMTGLKGIRHENPSMTFEVAAPLYEKLQKEMTPELHAMYASDDEDCACVMDHGYARPSSVQS